VATYLHCHGQDQTKELKVAAFIFGAYLLQKERERETRVVNQSKIAKKKWNIINCLSKTWQNVDHTKFHSIHAAVFTTAWKPDP
jgi:hypothetical protein